MAEQLYEQYAGLFDQQAELGEEAVVAAVRFAFGNLKVAYKRQLRFLVSPRGPPASQQHLTRAREKMEAASDSAARLIAVALSNAFGALSDFPPIELSEAVIYETSSKRDQTGPSIVCNPASTMTHRSTRDSAPRTVNYAEGMENSLSDQQGNLTITCKSKRKTDRSGKSNASKRSRVGPASTVSAAQVDDESEKDDPESGTISLGIIVRRLKCRVPGCKKVFPGKIQLDGHHLTKHAIEKYACKVKDCTESYATSGELKAHRNSAHDSLGNDWPCGRCEVTCLNYNQLATHIWFYHESGRFSCSSDGCDYTQKTRIRVKYHQDKVHLLDRYRCTFSGCTSSFRHKSQLTVHFRTHTKETPFVCSQCPKAFTQKGGLAVHERIHTGLKPYSCTWLPCDFSASNQSAVIAHIRGVHFGLPQSKTEQAKRGIIDTRDARTFVAKTAITSN